MLQDDQQHWIREPTQLKEMTLRFFKNLYTLVGNRDYGPVLAQCTPMVTNEMNFNLAAAITREEVWVAAFQLGEAKAPGLDGLNGQFYQSHWDILQDDIFSSVQEFFSSGVMQLKYNRTYILLIPKISHLERLNQY